MRRISGWRAGLTGCALVVATAACDVTGPDGVRAKTTFTYERAAEGEPPLQDTAGIQADGRRVDVHGTITGSNCYGIDGEPSVEGDRVVLTMRAKWSGGNMGCASNPGRFEYVARITGLSAGVWTVEVRHGVVYTPGEPAVVATEMVVIPELQVRLR